MHVLFGDWTQIHHPPVACDIPTELYVILRDSRTITTKLIFSW